MRILITGSRDWPDPAVIEAALMRASRGVLYHDVTLVSGACPTGADRMAEELAANLGMVVERHPADWASHGKAAGFIRNAEMVHAGADVCLAFQLNDSRGTGHTIQLARGAGIPTHVETRRT
jgi:hypothetical protein